MNQRLQRLQQLLEASPDDAFLLFAVAKEFEYSGDADRALQQYQHLRDRHPDYVGLYYHLGKLLEKTGQVSEALSVYQSGMLIARNAGDLHALSELNAARLEIDDSDDQL